MTSTIINQLITVRNKTVILDRDIASLLGMETFRFLERCKRNESLFDVDDYFQLTNDEFLDWRSQFAISNSDKKGLRRPPFCFTKDGIQILKTRFKKEDQQNIISDILNAFNKKENNHPFQKNELKNGLVTYVSDDGQVKFDVKFDDREPWITQQQIAQLFDSSVPNISTHISNIFDEKELKKNSVVKDFLTTGPDEKQYRVLHYNLDVIYSVGYRVKSQRGTQFRQWSNKTLRQHHMDGFTVKDRISKDQLNHAQHYVDNRTTNVNINIGGDVNIIVKNSPISVDTDQIDSEKVTSLLNDLEKKIKGSGLEHYICEQKKTKKGLQEMITNLIQENSWFRKGLSTISDAQDIIEKIVSLASIIS